jgi:hypothetical protein
MRIEPRYFVKYKNLEREDGADTCLYCGAPHTTKDYTPVATAATPKALDEYEGEWTIAKVCMPCWKRIYTVNIANGGIAFGVERGMMTVEMKIDALNKRQRRAQIQSIKAVASHSFVRNPDEGMYLPKDATILGDSIQVGVHSYGKAEMYILQIPICISYLNMPQDLIKAALQCVMPTLDPAKEPVYREMLGIEDQPTTTQGW